MERFCRIPSEADLYSRYRRHRSLLAKSDSVRFWRHPTGVIVFRGFHPTWAANGAVLAGAVKNFSELAASERLILHTTVSIGYEVDWRRVHELLLSAAAKTSRVLDEPSPFVRQERLNDFCVTYELNAYTDEPSMMSVTYSELRQNVLEAFNQAEVEILSPHYRAVRNGDPSTISGRSPSELEEHG